MRIALTGAYVDVAAREYVVMQDRVQRTDRIASIVFVRVMREGDEVVRSGTIYIVDDTFAGVGDDDRARNSAIARALVSCIAASQVADPFFQIRAVADSSDPVLRVRMLDEHRRAPTP